MLTYVLSAILSLAPQIGLPTARAYARIIYQETTRRGLDPLLLVAFVDHESNWNPRTRSHTNDYGLAQVHVAVRGSAKFLGREYELYRPRTNLREWCRLAAMWRDYHERSCAGKKHRWWKHLKWGYRVKDPHPDEIDALYQKLKAKFSQPPRPEV
jgi:hypothetical protein